MRKVLLIDRPVDDDALAQAEELGAAEVIECPDGVPPPALSGLDMGYHEVEESEPPRRLIPKSTVTARLIALGKAAEAKAALDAMPELYFRWVSPDWPEVYADDEGLLYVLGPDVLDLTQEQIATVTAP